MLQCPFVASTENTTGSIKLALHFWFVQFIGLYQTCGEYKLNLIEHARIYQRSYFVCTVSATCM